MADPEAHDPAELDENVVESSPFKQFANWFKRAEGKALIDYTFHICITRWDEHKDQIKGMVDRGFIAVIGALNGIILMNARVPFAMARDGLFFKRLGELNPTSRVPVAAIWTQAVWACVLALSGTFDQITTSVIFALWIFFALVGASLFVLRGKVPAAPRRYRTPGYPVVPILFVLVAVWLVISSVRAYPIESAVGVVLIALGLPFYLFFQIMRRRGVEADA